MKKQTSTKDAEKERIENKIIEIQNKINTTTDDTDKTNLKDRLSIWKEGLKKI